MRPLNTLACRAALSLITLYQHSLGYLLGGRCRFYPTCSEYAKICFTRLGFFRALRLTLWRLLRCQPLAKGGEDPPPER